MLKPIKTFGLKKPGLQMSFAQRIMERAAKFGGYELSEGELVFAVGAAREHEDLMSALELMDELLGLMRRGFDRCANSFAVKLVNNIEIILNKGGYSRAYFNAVEIYGRLAAVVSGGFDDLGAADITKLRAEIQQQRELLRNSGGGRSSRTAESISQNTRITPSREMTLNTLNTELLRISARNPELLKMLKADKALLPLSVKNADKLRRRAERSDRSRRFLEALSAEERDLLERFIADEKLFSETRERSAEHLDLKFLLENSSEKSVSEFFSALRTRLEEYSFSAGERTVFSSEREMKEFFVGASREEIIRLISRLEKDGGHGAETVTLISALRGYDAELERRKADAEKKISADIKLSEFENISETELRRFVNSAEFSEENFINALKSSAALKSFFAEYAWTNARTEDITRRYAAYAARNYPDAANGAADGDTVSEKERFSEYLLNSGELRLKFSESVKERFLGASPDVAAAFAEYLVNAVREDERARYGGAVRELAEKTENVLYREELDLNSKAEEVFSLIRGAWESCSEQLSELYAAFTQSGGYDELVKLYALIPKSDYKAVEEFFAAVGGDERFSRRSAELLTRLRNILSETNTSSAEVFERSDHSEYPESRYTFLDALNALPGGYQKLSALSSLAGGRSASESALFEDGVQTLEQSAAVAVAAAFSEYLSSEVRRAERIRELEERVGLVLNDENGDIEERASAAPELILRARDNGEFGDIGNVGYTDDTRDPERLTRLAELIKTIKNERSVSGGERPADKASVRELFSEFFKNETHTRYSEKIRILAENVGRVIYDEKTDIRRRAERSLELIYKAQSTGNAAEITALFESFKEKYSDRERLFEIYSRLPRNESETIFSALSSPSSEGGEKLLSEIAERFSERSQTLLESLREANSRDIDTDLIEPIERIVSAAFSERLSAEIRGGHYSEHLNELAERVTAVLHNTGLNMGERTDRAFELICSVYGENGGEAEGRELTRLYKLFAERYNDSERLLRLYSELPNNDLENVSRALSSAGGEKRLSELVERFSERFAASERSTGSNDVSRIFGDRALIYSPTVWSDTESKPDSAPLWRLFSAEDARALISALSDISERTERRVYSVSFGGNSSKSVVTGRALYNAFEKFGGAGIIPDVSGGIFETLSEYPELMPRELVFSWDRGSVTRFTREETERTREKALVFSRRRQAFAAALSERISEKSSASHTFMERNAASELFYTDNYIESAGGASDNAAVRFAVPAAASSSGSSEEVAEKLNELRGAVENISGEIESIKRRENELAREFVTKSEQRIFERELKSGIEQDIYLAGKRHGIL